LVNIYSEKEIDILRQGGGILSAALAKAAAAVRAGVSTYELNKIAEQTILELGGRPAFLGYKEKGMKPYPASLCASINDEIVHCLPFKDRILQDGDIIGLDLGVQFRGYYTDMAVTIAVGKVSDLAARLIEATRKSLEAAIGVIRPGATIGDIGATIQKFAEPGGFGVIRDLVGHGVGRSLHEEPNIPNYGAFGAGIKLRPGMILALEPMFSEKSPKIQMLPDGWGIATADGGLSAHFEKTVVVTKDGSAVLTP